jgi:hypothetical protein
MQGPVPLCLGTAPVCLEIVPVAYRLVGAISEIPQQCPTNTRFYSGCYHLVTGLAW